MQIVFVNYFEYAFSSGVHIHFIANEMTKMGHDCTVVLPKVANTNTFGEPLYRFSDYKGLVEDIRAGKYSSETIFHAWTPREGSRLPALVASQALNAPYFVHLEDNERRILEAHEGRPFAEIMRDAATGKISCDNMGIHPILHQTFLAEACGVSVLMDKLAEFVPSDVPTRLVWPACEPVFFQLPKEPDLAARAKYGIPEDAALIVYPGNIHQSNVELITPLYRALPLVEEAGHKIRLIRCAGADIFTIKSTAEAVSRYVTFMPQLPPKKLPEMIGMSDILIQPGSPNPFDEYRFPSKLPLFLASGRPVILARANLGRFMEDGENCLMLEDNSPQDIANKIIWLLEHKGEAERIGHNGRKFAAQNFNWAKTAKTLVDFYEKYGHKKGALD